MEPITIHISAVLLGALAMMILGALWYSPLLFAKPWMAAVGKKEEELNTAGSWKLYLGMAVLALVLSYVLAHVVGYLGLTTASQALQLAFWAWIGIVVPTISSDYMFEGRSFKLYAINVGYQLVSLIAITLILTLWQ